ncbi:alpha/beta fold hydrolase [Aridibaculum aurantiacum]|uniref:alpha/beta fold hydrolase n=1 Tax=Aridibaculum aurantiacum TaxID=2810307 RepID=UPI001A9616AA|nr:alpha/beta hydrolase [Aridibaculum aurantiacum]
MKPLLLLHGAIGSQEQLAPLKHILSSHYIVHSIDFSGHGGKPFANDFSIEQFAQEVKDWLREQKLKKITLFGYSMGGYVALYLAKHYPSLVEGVATLGTKLHWDEMVAGKETAMLNPVKMQQKVPAFADQLKNRHHPNDWQELVNKTSEMLHDMGANPPLHLFDFKEIKCPVLLVLGDRDQMVSLVETATVYKQLPNGQLAILPATPHAIEQVDLDLLSAIFLKHLAAKEVVKKPKQLSKPKA